MRPVWSGVIGFGLVNIPVRLFSPTREESLKFNLLHKSDHSPIRYARICREEDKEVPWEDIVKGFKLDDEQYVVLTEQDFTKANARKTKTIDILHFTEEEDVDTLLFAKPYYLQPETRAEKAYVLLREALIETGKVGIATFVLRNREHLAVVKPYKDALLLDQLRYVQEVQTTESLDLPSVKSVAIHGREREIAIELIQKLTEPFRPEKYKDRYTNELRAIIAERAKGRVPRTHGRAPVPTRAADLMQALRKSLEREPVTSR